ncbi:MAG: Rpn family recombination-promoting nuclease/putative transposase [Solobacterium sp.]|nr:Rpn family recombination-promoting nuclease/putative transposase [Solobacterium sp.]
MERFETLPFKNDFMFSAVCHENPEIVRKMTEIIVGRKITKVHNIYQQDWVSIDPTLKKIRLDVTFEGDEAIYCVEMQVGKEKELPRRIRYYQSAKDIEQINKGGRYEQLQPLYIIFICDYDPFGLGLSKYSFHTQCMEAEYELEDGRGIIVLNTTGIQTEDLPLNALLEYIHSGKKNEEELTEEIEEAADRIRYNKDWRERFMTIGEKIERESQKAAEEAKEQERFKAIVNAVQMLRELNYEEERIGYLIPKHFELSADEYKRILEQISSLTCDGEKDS